MTQPESEPLDPATPAAGSAPHPRRTPNQPLSGTPESELDATSSPIDLPAESSPERVVEQQKSAAAEPAGESVAPEPTTDRTTSEPVTSAASSSEPVTSAEPTPEPVTSAEPTPEPAVAGGKSAPWRRLSSAGSLIWVLLALLGFTLVVQLRSNDGDQRLASARQEDLVRILSDLEARDSRLQTEIAALEDSQRNLTSGVAGRQAALAEAEKRTDELGLLAGTLRGQGPGLRIVLDKVKASAVLNAVQELRGAGGEVMELDGSNGTAVRIVASSYFVDAQGSGILVDGSRLTGPYTVQVIGTPQIMQTALQIPGGVVASVNSAGGSVTMETRATVEVTAVRKATTLQYARPVS